MGSITPLIISVGTYLILGIYMYYLGMCAQNGVTLRIKDYRLFDPNIFISILLFALICGLRYNVGTDCENYVRYFEHIADTGSNIADYDEPLFTAFTLLIAKINGGRVLYLAAIAFFELLFFYSAFKTRRFLYPFLGLVLILGPHFLDFNNGLRQMIVACIFVFALQQAVDNKRFLLFLLLIAFGMTIHSSAIILLLAVPVVWYKGVIDYRIASALLVLSIAISNLGIIDPILSKADGVLYLLGYDAYGDRMDYYLDMEAQISHYGPRRLIQIASYFLIVFFSKDMYRFYKRDRFFRISYLLFLIFAVFYEILASKSLLFTRPLLYLSTFWLICAAYLLNYFYKCGKTKEFWVAVFIFCSYSILSTLVDYRDPSSFYVYRYIFTQNL